MLVVLAVAVQAGCSSGSRGTSSAGGADGGQALAINTGQVVPAGTESLMCQFVAMPDAAVFVTGMSHAFSQAYHHLYVFKTDLPSLPAGSDTPIQCGSGSPNPMDHAGASIYAAELGTGSMSLPAGVGLPMQAGEVLLIQSHYLNATASDIDAQASLSIDYVTEDPGAHAGAFFFYDPFIDVGIGQLGNAAMRCAVPSDVTVLSTVAGAQERAVGFLAFDDPPSATAEDPFYQAPGWADPLPVTATIPLAAGSHLRFSCAYDNTSGTIEYLQGTDPDNSEQCILSGLYYPDQGDAFADCASPDQFGTGNASCAATRTCVDACPSGSAPPANLGLGGGKPAMSSCWQRCIVASQSDAAGLLFSLRACIATGCSSECGADDSDDGSPACASCIQAQCAAENAACEGGS
jgi:hypothetical protein